MTNRQIAQTILTFIALLGSVTADTEAGSLLGNGDKLVVNLRSQGCFHSYAEQYVFLFTEGRADFSMFELLSAGDGKKLVGKLKLSEEQLKLFEAELATYRDSSRVNSDAVEDGVRKIQYSSSILSTTRTDLVVEFYKGNKLFAVESFVNPNFFAATPTTSALSLFKDSALEASSGDSK